MDKGSTIDEASRRRWKSDSHKRINRVIESTKSFDRHDDNDSTEFENKNMYLWYNALYTLPKFLQFGFWSARKFKLRRKSKEDEDLDRYIFRTQIDSLIKNYILAIKSLIIAVVVFCIILNSVYYIFELNNTQIGWVFIVQVYYLMAYLSLCYLMVHFFVSFTPFLIPLSVLFLLFITVNIGTGSEKYQVTEYMLPATWLVNILIVVVPSQWSINSLAFIGGMCYYIHQVNSHYGVVPVPLLWAIWLSTMYFTFTSYILFRKLRTLYKLLRENQKLNAEMKRLLQIFPESVIIRTKDFGEIDGNQYFANQEFKTRICDINKHVNQLNRIVLSFNDDKHDDSELVKSRTTLETFLKHQEEQLVGMSILEKNNVTIKCKQKFPSYNSSLDADTNEDDSSRMFKIKTLKVNWEGNANSYLHVFIDITDIQKLEEANNSIKCQKIMFASVSHEF